MISLKNTDHFFPKRFFSYRLFVWMLLLMALVMGGGGYLIIAEVRVEAEGLLVKFSKEINKGKEVLGRIQKNARNAEAIDTIGKELVIIEASVSEINTLIANGDFLTALDKITAAQTREDIL